VVLVPEPGVWALALLGALGLLGWRSRRPLVPVPVRNLPLNLNLNLNPALPLPPARRPKCEGIKMRSKIKSKSRSGVCVWLLLLLCLLGPGQMGAQAQTEAEFTLNGTELTLAEVTPEADVYFRSMRLNRALNVWNVEVTVSNKAARVLSGPVVLLLDGFSGTTGLQSPDGTTTDGKGFLDLSAEAGDGALAPGEVTVPRTLTLGRSGTSSPTLTTKVYAARPPVVAALGVTRSLDEAGRPLPGVALAITGPVGSGTQTSDAPSGVASFGQGPGEHLLKFSTEGYLPVWRKQTLSADRTTVLPNPRLTKRSAQTFTVTPLGGTTVSNATGTIAINLDAGAVSQTTTVTLTPLTGQNLPAFLPPGWSPLNSFWLESSTPVTGTLNTLLRPLGPISPAETAALVRWNETGLQWLVVQTLGGQGTNAVNALLPGTGAYALVVGDAGELAPPAAQLGAALAGSNVGAIDPAGLSATGEVTPPASPASVIPEFVTGTAHVELRHASQRLPSGHLLRGEVTETYLLSDGSLRLTPQYEHFVVGYQRPGDQDPFTLHARFPMRPVLLFGSDQLDTATVRVEVLPEQPFDGQVLDQGGGQIGAGGVRLLAGSGRLTGPSALRLRRLDATVFTNLVSAGQEVVAAFDLTVDGSTLTGTLGAQLTGAPADGLFVVARVLSEVGYYGLQPVERLQSDAQGNLQSLEPASGERLPGLRGSGQFVLVRVGAAQGLISGVARNGAGEVQPDMPVRLTGLPWLTLTDALGRFQLVAPVGEVEVGVTDPRTGDTGFVSVTIPDPQTPVGQDVATAPAGPRVAQITPAHNATRVPRVGSVVIRFNEAVNPATVLGAIQLLRPDDSIVTAALTLNLRNTIATLSPAVELEANTTYRVRLAATIADPGGLPLEGQSEFSFTTVPLSTRVATAQLIIYEPGATNVPSAILDDIPAFEPGEDPFAIVVHGQPGVADPEVPVILVNESTGETQTVLSKVDGSFSSFISGTEEDFVSATFVNLNGTRVYVPVSRQEFDDGFVGLYPQGGILEAQSDGGPVRVLIEPQAIETKAKLRLASVSLAELNKELNGVTPEAATIAGGALNLEVEGDIPEGGIQVSMPVDLAKLGYPADLPPEEAALALTVVSERQGVKAFEVLGPMTFRADPNASQGMGAPRLAGPVPHNEFLTAGFIEAGVGFLPGGNLALGIHQFMIVPMLIGNRPVVVTGKVVAAPTVEGGSFLGSLVANQLLELGLGTRLSGAFVILKSPGSSLALPGRLQPGMVYSTSGRDGKYLMVAPVGNAGYVISATHPRFRDRQTQPVFPLLEFSLAGAVGKDFVFTEPLAFQSPPRINIAHTPLYPAPSQNCVVQVNASSGAATAPTITVTVDSVVPLAGGVEADVEDVVIEDVQEEVVSGNRKRWTGTVRTDKAVRVFLKVSVTSPSSPDLDPFNYPVDFGGAPPPPVEGQPPPSDPSETLGPVVLATFPPENGYVNESGEVRIIFNEPINKSVTNDLAGIVLSGPGPGLPPSVRLNEDQRELTLQWGGLQPGSEYTLMLSGASIRDLTGNPLDQKPGTSTADSFTMTFLTAPVETTSLPGMTSGGSVVISGTRLYAINRGDDYGLFVYDISIPSQPVLLSKTPLRGFPRDLVVIPGHSYKKTFDGAVRTSELVAVVGGDLGGLVDEVGNVFQPGQYLRVYDMSDPAIPERLATPIITYRISAVRKVRWEAPYLSFLEFGADIQFVGTIDLQEMILGFNATREQIDAFPNEGVPGEDKNNDGDYVDEGDTLPIPMRRPPEFFGKKNSHLVEGSTQHILDHSVTVGAVGVTLTKGRKLNNQGEPTGPELNPSYRTLSYNGFDVDAIDGTFYFGAGAHPKRLTIIDGLPLIVSNAFTTPIVALISLAPDADGIQKLALLDITLPESPTMINQVEFPEALIGGYLQSVVQRADGMLELATTQNLFVLDPTKLAEPQPAGGLHPAVAAFIPNGGSGSFSQGTTTFGVHSVVHGGKNVVQQTPPPMSFVSFPSLPAVVNPGALPPGDAELSALLDEMRVAPAIIPARLREVPDLGIFSDLSPPSPVAHYHVYVEAPGGAGETVEIGLESLNMAGKPFSNLGLGFAPVRAVTSETLEQLGQQPRPNCDAPMRPLTAHRMSDDPKSLFFNRYLSRPFAVVYERVSLAELTALQGELDREILWNGAYLRAFIDPKEGTDAAVGAFAAKFVGDTKSIRPIAGLAAPTLDLAYIMGGNPPPAGGYFSMPGTFGMVSAHSGEFRTEAVDMALPSPRMPIEFERVIGGQDLYEGPFGRGWDFNYNQRLIELKRQVFPAGLEVPLIIRHPGTNSVTATSGDVLFHTGAGRMIRFKHIGTNTPPEYAADPLVIQFNWNTLAADFYLPEPGVFDLLVRFKDGKFERMTPDGTRFRYAHTGRLEEVIDRYPDNRQVLEYDRLGRLVRIDDRSVETDRFLELGYYRYDADVDFTSGLDESTTDPFREGKICRLKDYAGTDVLFFYDDEGLLIRREGPEVAGENGGFSGRSKTHYVYDNCKIKGITVGQGGAPMFATETTDNAAGEPVASAGNGIAGPVALVIPMDITSATLEGLSTSAGLADGSNTEYTFDREGYPTGVKQSGSEGGVSEAEQKFNEHGQITFIRHPEGNTETYGYDEANSNFRSRGNLRSVTVDPGPRGGEGYTATYDYDPRHNLPTGTHRDANGFVISYTLTSDGRNIASIGYGGAGTASFDYNDRGQIESHTSPEGFGTEFDYDGATGFLAGERKGDNTYGYGYDGTAASKLGRPSTVTPPAGAAIQTKYDANLQLVERTRGALVEKRAYDEQGRMKFLSQDVGDSKKREATFTYDEKGFLLSTRTDGIEVEGAETSIEYLYTPDELSRMKAIVHPGGALQSFKYNKRGEVIQMSLGEYVEDYVPDRHGNIAEIRHGGEVVETTEYDGLDRPKLIKRKTAEGDILIEYTYFPGGQVKSMTITDPVYGVVQKQTTDTIDELGRPQAVNIEGDTISPSYSYSWSPGEVSVTGPRQTTTSRWNPAGHATGFSSSIANVTQSPDGNGLIREIQSAEDGATYTVTFDYDDLDNRKSMDDPLGNRFTYVARTDGSLLSVSNGRNNTTTLEHTALGEPLRETRADGMEVRFRHDKQRSITYTGDPTAGFGYEYDSSFRLKQRKLRNGATITFDGFDPRRMPQSATLPGGGMSMTYDLQRRLTTQSVSFDGADYAITHKHDALERIREVTYNNNTATYDYDRAGPLLNARFEETGGDFEVGYTYYDDATRKTINYPSGVVVTEDRDTGGRLLGVSDGTGDIYRVTSWQGNAQPGNVLLGPAINVVNQYDARGRLTASRATRVAGNAVLAHLRYQYDAADNLEARQFIHRAGRADLFTYDNGERVATARIGALPGDGGAFDDPLYSRTYTYHAAGLDYLIEAPATVATGVVVPPFAAEWSSHDAFLQPTVVAGFNRGAADPLGHVARAALQARPAAGTGPVSVGAGLEHNGLGHLVRIVRDDGLSVENEFQPSGLRHFREIKQGATVMGSRAFVHDATGRLLEEYETSGASSDLVGRYYYAAGDAPVAADLRDGLSGLLKRYYYLTAVDSSVIAVADDTGTVVERVWYDTFGQPVIEQRDAAKPVIRSILAGAGGSILIVLSEAVLAGLDDPGPGTGLVAGGQLDASGITIIKNDTLTPLSGSASFAPSATGFDHGTVIVFMPNEAFAGPVTVNVAADALADDWGNRNNGLSVSINLGGPVGTVYFEATPAPNTAPHRLARSSVNSPFLFHGQYFDYESGLLYLRARFYDPFSGMFLEPDPLGYEDSVNLYAGFGNNPTSYRDPDGTNRRVIRELAEQSTRKTSKALTKQGLSDMEIDAIINVMARRKDNIRLSIRKFVKYDDAGNPITSVDTARWRRFYSSQGLQQKGAATKAKNGLKATGEVVDEVGGNKRVRKIVSDVDALHVEINGRMASISEMRQLFGDVNREYARLFRAKYGRGKRVNPPFQHDAQAHLGQQLGSRIGTKISKSGIIDMDYISKVGHPGDAFIIEFSGKRGGRTFATRNLSRDEVDDILLRGEELLKDSQRALGEPHASGWPPSWDVWKNGTLRRTEFMAE
jgi:RHS repeat-associated protein